jgi:hypothetical protein
MTAAQPLARNRLDEVPLFRDLSPAALDAPARVRRGRRYLAGQVLWTEGDPGSNASSSPHEQHSLRRSGRMPGRLE